MVGAKTLLLRYSETIKRLNSDQEEIGAQRYVGLFFAFDIVNSSAYKTLNYNGWSKVIISLLNKIQQSVAKAIPDAQIWRVLGDELVYFVPIKEKEDFRNYTEIIFEMLCKMVHLLKTGAFFDEIKVLGEGKELMKMQNIISLKSAAWIAIVGDGIDNLEQYDNVIEKYKFRENYGMVDFLGNDIDAGFRLKSETQDRRLTISYELAYILSKETDCIENINIITYKRLRGIWQNRLYPIIWYYNSKYMDGIPFEGSFYYDEKESNSLVKEYFENRVRPVLSKEMYDDVNIALGKLLKDQGLESKFQKIDAVIMESKNPSKNEGGLLGAQFWLNLHCVAVCFEKEPRRILILKRNADRKLFPNCWEFGCAKGTIEKTLIVQIQQEYKDDIGITIEVICNDFREDKQPIPLFMYEVDNEYGKDKGVIVLAEVMEAYDINEFQGSKHSEAKWISEEEITSFAEEAVPDFKNTLEMAFKKIGELYGSESAK